MEREGGAAGGRAERGHPASGGARPHPAGRRLADAAAVAAAIAVLAGALWLRGPREGYLALAAVATAAALAAGLLGARRLRPGIAREGRARALRGATLLFVALAAALLALGVRTQRELDRIADRWPETSAGRRDAALAALDEAVTREAREAIGRARAALAVVPPRRSASLAAFDALAPLAAERPERAVAVLGRDGRPLAWRGVGRLAPDTVPDGVAVTLTPFYAVLHAAVRAPDGRRGIALTLLHAERPTDTLSAALDREVAEGLGAGAITWAPAAAAPDGEPGWRVLALDGRPLAAVRARVPDAVEARERAQGEARRRGVPLVLLMSAVVVAALWRRPASLERRLAAIAVPLAAVWVAPLNALSNASFLFDPTVFYAPVGGPLTASGGALVLTGGLLLLGLFAVLRSGRRPASRTAALLGVVAIGVVAPYLLRALARGIAPPAGGVPVALWVTWQVALFLPAAALLVGGAAAGRAALGAGRGLPPIVAPVIAGIAAVGGPILWQAPGGWPDWYTAPWIAAIVALALTRRTRAQLVSATAVAGLGAAVLVWSATARQRVAQAERDVAGLVAPDEAMVDLLIRFGRDLAEDAAVREGPFAPGGLLRRWAQSALAPADYPVALASWSPPDPTQPDARSEVVARAATVRWRVDSVALRAVVAESRREGVPVLREIAAEPGTATVLAVPHPGGWETTVTVLPRTRLLPSDPTPVLLGIPRPAEADPPYTLALRTRSAPRAATPETRTVPLAPDALPRARWEREGTAIHGDWLLPLAGGVARAHAEVELRPLDALMQRGALLVLLDLLLAGALWSLPALADGAVRRWWRWGRAAWLGSFRARLTLVLFAFFAIPTVAFAAWSYGQLQAGDRESRELLVRETLRAAAAEAPGANADALATLAARLGTPILAFRDGVLVAASDPALVSVAPFGRFLPPEQWLALGVGGEITSSRLLDLGGAPTLVGFRAVGPAADPVDEGDAAPGALVLAAPARLDDPTLGQRRRDLAALVTLAAAGAALAALWLSGLVARQLARPVGALREAALAVAGGERLGRGDAATSARARAAVESALAGDPPVEFRPVFDGFRRMAADLDAGREELARAQRVLAWGEMARQVAHEIKNPLTPIRLGVQHLRRAWRDGRMEFGDILERNVERVLAEIDRLDEIARAFSKYGTAPDRHAPALPLDVAALATDVVALERLEQGGAVRWEAEGLDGPVWAMARDGELREVLLNLLENARLAHARTVRVSLEREPGRVTLVVEDDGEGIASDVLPRIFEPHFSTRTSGSGLGLAISRRLVEAWGGTVTAESARGVGTTLSLTLLAADAAPDGAHAAASAAPAGDASGVRAPDDALGPPPGGT